MIAGYKKVVSNAALRAAQGDLAGADTLSRPATPFGSNRATSAGTSIAPPAASRRLHRKLAAAHLGVSLSWLDKSRLRGDGPVYLQIGGRVIYDTADLDAFLERHRRRSTSEPP